MTDYVDGKAAWFAAGLPAEGEVSDGQRIGALAVAAAGGRERHWDEGDPPTVRPGEPIRDVLGRLRDEGDAAPPTLFVTTPNGRLVGTVDTATLRALATADELP